MNNKVTQITVGQDKISWFAYQMCNIAKKHHIPSEVAKLSAELFTNSIAESTNSEPYANILGFVDDNNLKYWKELFPDVTESDCAKLNHSNPKQRRKILRKYLKI